MTPLKTVLKTLLAVTVLLGMVSGSFVQAREAEQQATFQVPILVVNTSFLNVRTGPGAQYTILVTVVGGTELPALGVASDGVWYQVATDAGPGWVNVSFTLPRGNFTNLPTVEVGQLGIANFGQGGGATAPVTGVTALPSTNVAASVASSGNRVTGVSLIGRDLHQQPDADSLFISRAVPNDPNTIYPLLNAVDNEGETWYLVNIPGIGTGWTVGVELRILACSNETVVTLTSEQPINFDGIANREPFLLPVGTEMLFLNFTGTGNIYSRVQLADGTIGNVATDATQPRPSNVRSVCEGVPTVANLGQGGGAVDPNTGGVAFTTPQLQANRMIVNTGNLNLRSGPSAGFAVVATVPGGAELVVLGRATDNVWYLVETGNVRGWINSEFAIFRGNFATVPIIRDEVIVPLQQQVISLGQGGGAAATTINTSVGSGRQVTGVSLIGRDLRAEPSAEALIVSRAVPNDPNTIYPLLDAVTTDGTTWYRVNVPNIGVGWTVGVELRALQCGSDQVVVTTGEVPITFDGIANREPFLVPLGTEAYLVGQRGTFALVELVDGTVGLIANSDLVGRSNDVRSVCSGVPALTTAGSIVSAPNTGAVTTPATVVTPTLSANRVIINTGNLNIRSGPSAGFAAVATVAGGSELAVVGRAPDGVWYLVQGTFGQGWVNSEFTIFRGDFATVPVIDF